MAAHRFRVLLVDDHELVLWGLRLALARQPWCERAVPAADGDEAETFARRFEPHVAVVDLFVGEETGIEIGRRVRAAAPGTRLLLMSGAGRLSARAAKAAGAHGFVGKHRRAADIASVVQAVASGHTFYESARTPMTQQAGLTDREREILGLIAEGATNPEIAAALFLSPHTVKQHTSSLYRKLGVRNRAQAVQAAQRVGLL